MQQIILNGALMNRSIFCYYLKNNPEGAQEYNRSQVWYYPSTPVARVYGKVYNCNTIIKSVV